MIYTHPVSIIIVNYNKINDTLECLNSLKETTYPYYEIIVVDNGSKDGSKEILEKIDNIKLIKLDKNYGATAAWNIGFKHATNEYICFLSNDIVVDKNWLSELMNTMQETDVAESYASFLYYAERFDTTDNIKRIKYLKSGSYTLLGYLVAFDFFDDNKMTSLDADTICCIIKKSLVDKPFDDDYFLYFEGAYLAWKLRLMGYDIKRAPLSLIYHKGTTSVGKFSGIISQIFLIEKNRIMNLLIFYSNSTLAKVVPLIILDAFKKAIVVIYNIFIQPTYSMSIFKAHMWILSNLGKILKKRERIQSLRKIDDSKIVSLLSYKWSTRESYFVTVLNAIFYAYCKVVNLKTYDVINKT